MYKVQTKFTVNSNEMLEKRITNYWNNRSVEFSRVRRKELLGENGKAWLNLINAHLPAKKLKILDVGTGAGFFAIMLANQGHEVTAIDMSKKMLTEAKKNMLEYGCRVDFKYMNAQQINFNDDTFDVVISRNLTWTLPDVAQAYSEWTRVLKSDGILMNFDSDYGDKNFCNEQTCARANVADDMLNECNAIKNALSISTQQRPSWDIEFLSGLGLEVSFDEDIAPLVQRDSALDYDSVPLFAIYANAY